MKKPTKNPIKYIKYPATIRTIGINPYTNYPYILCSDNNVWYCGQLRRSNCGNYDDFMQNLGEYKIKLTDQTQ